MTPGLVDEIVVIDLLALFLAVAAVEIIWYVVKKAFPDQVRDLRFFLTFIVVIVPFVLTVCFGIAIINYDAIAIRSGWPTALPLQGLIVAADHRWGNFLYRPNAVAMVELA